MISFLLFILVTFIVLSFFATNEAGIDIRKEGY